MLSQLLLISSWLVGLALSGVISDNVTITEAPVAKYQDVCTNECSETDPSSWCGKYRKDSSGKAMKCAQYTVNGKSCVAECAKKTEKYYWCMTNAYRLADPGPGAKRWWDYCSLDGYTTNNKKCTDKCGKQGEKYYWCHTSTRDSSEWDYCSPPGSVRPVQYTVKGSTCNSECAKHSEKYYWCTKSFTCGSKNCKPDWDYCSPDEYHTRYNEKCKKRCNNDGEDYYYCYKADGEWDYCSPTPKLGSDITENVELTIMGVKCTRKCAKHGEKYYWCPQLGGGSSSWWDYCSPGPRKTITSDRCQNTCKDKDTSYFWCSTYDGWDYCSPSSVPGGSRQYRSRTPVWDWIVFIIVLIPVVIIACVFIGSLCLALSYTRLCW